MGQRKVLITATYELEKYVYVDDVLSGDDLHERLGNCIPSRVVDGGDDFWLHDWQYEEVEGVRRR